MKIVSIDHRRWDFDDGLSRFQVQNLNRIVVLAGSNGSGKTRLLRRIELMNGHHLHESDERILQHYPCDADGRFVDPRNFPQLKRHALGVSTDPPRSTYTRSILTELQIVPFVSRNLELSDPNEMTPKKSLDSACDAEIPGATLLARSGLPYLQRCQGRYWESTHPSSRLPPEEKSQYESDYAALKDLIQLVMGAELGRNADGIATLFERPIPQAQLSDGQRALLQWCIGLHAQKAKLHDIVLTMDEPENHLHPEALNETVGRIINANNDGQIWIGTHSVPLIANLFHCFPDQVSLYYMEGGNIHYSGRSPERILTSLMGGEENIQALREFIDLPGVLATNRFAAECLLVPTVVYGANPDDPQALVVGSTILGDVGNETTAKILDFGAGHCRLLECLNALHGKGLRDLVDYFAWDITPDPESRCIEAFQKVYGSHSNRWFNDSNMLAANCPPESFDVIIMCNVFHEIPPTEWVSLFGPTGVIRSNLKEDGSLLIVEDYLMPKGEYAHSYGFIVLDTAALQKLFASPTGTAGISMINAAGLRYRDRIKGHVIPRALLEYVDGESIKKCLDFAASNAERNISALRDQSTREFKSGQAHAFWVQQFANATLARKSFG